MHKLFLQDGKICQSKFKAFNLNFFLNWNLIWLKSPGQEQQKIFKANYAIEKENTNQSVSFFKLLIIDLFDF